MPRIAFARRVTMNSIAMVVRRMHDAHVDYGRTFMRLAGVGEYVSLVRPGCAEHVVQKSRCETVVMACTQSSRLVPLAATPPQARRHRSLRQRRSKPRAAQAPTGTRCAWTPCPPPISAQRQYSTLQPWPVIRSLGANIGCTAMALRAGGRSVSARRAYFG